MLNSSSSPSRSFIESAIALLLLLVLLFALYNSLSVFLGVFTYAIIFAVSFFKLFEKFVSLLWNKRKLAAFVYGLFLIDIIAIPFIYISSALGNYLHRAEAWINHAKTHGVPELPSWINGLPLVGKKISGVWDQLQADPAATISLYEVQIRTYLRKLLSGGGGIVGSALELILGIIVSAILLAVGEKALQPIQLVMKKIVGDPEGLALVDASGRAIKGVAIGVMGTAFIAAILAWIGFAIAGISFAIGLAALTFFLVVIQLGPLLVWLPVAIWLGSQGQVS